MVAAAGGRSAILDLNETAAMALCDEVGSAEFYRADVSDAAAVERALHTLGRVDVAINCAGIAPAERTVGREGPASLDLFDRVIRINLVGTFNVCRLAASAMTRNEAGQDGERGVIINTASVAAYDGQIGQTAYSASKGGVVGMTLPMARDLSKLGIRVMTIAPGIFETPMMAGMPPEASGLAGGPGALPIAARQARRVRGAGAPHHRKQDAEWRGDPARWRDPHGAEVAGPRPSCSPPA